ncbi:MAG: hypothetical protein GWM98_27430 [Nitrospinaceae bacterium]|nr:ABC transporter substrate-binding protein [Nitrospinaceae bacterium]NIR57506.1 ABC transporter substrate-binding protein [Nitrospinaceae bacterium]NIS87976.1 ABC transporter substrate-binding protein [Nitrospinaceae bacterium]NIT84841.1 ABC transporter substrate-binding protein [Nitrospinaceae bacterium]NIU47021.1 ABC transporter substrate-binding protein [Nitrospinaceae bacterium]
MSQRRIPIAIVLLLLFFFGFAAVPLAAGEKSPEKCVQELLNAIQQIKTGEPLSPQDIENNRKYSDRALDLLNLDEVSQKTLGKYWEKLSPNDREKFSSLLRQLFVHVAFPNSGQFFSDLQLVYEDTRFDRSQAVVPVRVIHPDEGEVAIDFYLRKRRNQWEVVDVLLDSVSMRNNLRNQFYKVIGQKDYGELVRRMEKRLQETKS